LRYRVVDGVHRRFGAYLALPSLRAALGADLATVQWVITGYVLALAALTLIGGALADTYGKAGSCSSAASCLALRPPAVRFPGRLVGSSRRAYCRELPPRC